jgi:hypothetical protein
MGDHEKRGAIVLGWKKSVSKNVLTNFISVVPIRPTIIAESQPALKFRVNQPRPRSHPARAGRACVLVFYFISRQLGQL